MLKLSPFHFHQIHVLFQLNPTLPRQQQQLALRLAVRAFSAEAYPATLRSKSVEIWGTQSETKKNRPQTARSRFTSRTATAVGPHRQLQPAKLRRDAHGVCEGVGCASQQLVRSQKNDSVGWPS